MEKIIIVGQLLKLALHSVGNFWLTIAEAATPKPRHTVEKFIAICIIDIDVLGTLYNSAAGFGVLVKVGKRVKMRFGV